MTDLAENSPREHHGRNAAVWAALAAVLALYIFQALRTRPASSWGAHLDSGVYFSSAKALASGQGYTQIWFPGHLPSTKYPALFPLILAGVWKVDPHFPGNLKLAVGISIAFGCLALLLTFVVLRRWPELGDWPALGIVFLVSLSLDFLLFSPVVLSDVPFMVLMLGAAWLADRSLDETGGTWMAFGSGALAGMSVGMRSVGVAVAAGIGLLFLFRRKFQRLFWFCLAGLPLTLLWAWPTVSAVLGLTPAAVTGDPTRSGWTQTLCFYSSYACQWRMSVPNPAALGSVMILNLRSIALEPRALLLGPLFSGNGILGLAFGIPLGLAAYAGIVRSWRAGGCRSLHAIFPVYLTSILGFPNIPARYLFALAPLFLAGLWIEADRLRGFVAARMRRGSGRIESAGGFLLAAAAPLLAVAVLVNLGYVAPKVVGMLGRRHTALLADELGAFSWLRNHSLPQARVIAYQDSLTYLYTHRKAIRPIYCLTDASELRKTPYIQEDVEHLGDVARHVQASYWLKTPYDFPDQTPEERALLHARQNELLAGAHVVYRSADGEVTLYDTRCVWGVGAKGCAPQDADARPRAPAAVQAPEVRADEPRSQLTRLRGNGSRAASKAAPAA